MNKQQLNLLKTIVAGALGVAVVVFAVVYWSREAQRAYPEAYVPVTPTIDPSVDIDKVKVIRDRKVLPTKFTPLPDPKDSRNIFVY